MSRLPHLAQRLFNVPLALHPAKAEIVMAALADRFGIGQMLHAGRQVALRPADVAEDRAEIRAYDVIAGVAIIPVTGTLVQKLGCVRPWSGMTGYDGIRLCFLDAITDPAVQAVVLDIDSPGGEVAGCFDLADTIFEARGAKPIHAILNECAYSAAYALASAADRVIVPRTGGTGSIGVICLHADLSQAMTKAGITVTLVRYGAHKAAANEYEQLPDDARARLQADVDATGELFVATVARNRGLKPSAVRATQADTFQGTAGVSIGLADAVMAPDAAFRALLDTLA